MKVKDIINQENYKVKISDSIDKVLELMIRLHINGLPVVDDSDKLVGMIVKADIYRFMIAPGHYDSCPVEWVMSKTVISTDTEEEILTVAKTLRDNDINSMPVTHDKEVVGTVSVEDLLDYFIKNDKEI